MGWLIAAYVAGIVAWACCLPINAADAWGRDIGRAIGIAAWPAIIAAALVKLCWRLTGQIRL